MKKIYLLILSVLVISCGYNPRSRIMDKIWISNEINNPKILYFQEDKLVHYYLFWDTIRRIESDTLNWENVEENYLDVSKNDEFQFKILLNNFDSLTVENKNSSTSYYPLSTTKEKYSKNKIKVYFQNNSFIVKSSLSNKLYYYDFITENKCINRFDSMNFQLENWSVENVGNEMFLIVQHPIFFVCFRPIKLEEKMAEFEYYYNGSRTMSFEKVLLDKGFNNDIYGKWFCELKDDYINPPPPPNQPQRKIEYVEGICYDFKLNGTYYYENRFVRKKGTWRFSFNKNYILLDTLKDVKSVLRINNIQDSILSLSFRDKYGETQQCLFNRID